MFIPLAKQHFSTFEMTLIPIYTDSNWQWHLKNVSLSIKISSIWKMQFHDGMFEQYNQVECNIFDDAEKST